MMELDNFKELWAKDKNNEMPEISLAQQRKIHSPLEMVRLNMLAEFILTLLSLPLMFSDTKVDSDNNLEVISIFLFVVSLSIMVYFFFRLRKVYNVIAKKDANTNYDLFNLKTQLLVMKEIYKSYYVSYIPFFFISYLIPIGFHFDMKYSLSAFLIMFGMSLFMLFLIIKVWFKFMYGRYINEIVYMVDELNGIDAKPSSVVKTSKLYQFQNFLINKMGLLGNIIYVFLLLSCSVIVIGCGLGIIFGFSLVLGIKLNWIDYHEFMRAIEVILNKK